LLQARIGGHMRREPIRPQGAAHIQQDCAQHGLIAHDADPSVQSVLAAVTQ
jgi:hypothetical protein